MNKWYMTNVVWYDGSDAFVSKFILQTDMVCTAIGEAEFPDITKESQRKVREYLNGNGEALKFDPLYPVSFDEIVSLRNRDDQPELKTAYDRFKEMWF